MPLYYAITNRVAKKLPLTWASIKQGGVHDHFINFLEARKSSAQKEELNDDNLVDTGLVMQRRFYNPRGKKEAIEKITTHKSASTSQSGENTALSQPSASGSGGTTRPRRLKKRPAEESKIDALFAGVEPWLFLTPNTRKRTKEATFEEQTEISSSDDHSTAEVNTPPQHDTPPRSKEKGVVTSATSRRKLESTMEPVSTQVKSVTSNTYQEGFQSTLEMAITVVELPQWVSNDTGIGDGEIESAYTKFMEAISVNTAGKKNFLCLFDNMMDTIGKLEKVFGENKRNNTKKKPINENDTRRPKNSGGNAHVSNEAGYDLDGD
jgi:hypothetical protein